jgi:hypothetical protein
MATTPKQTLQTTGEGQPDFSARQGWLAKLNSVFD